MTIAVDLGRKATKQKTNRYREDCTMTVRFVYNFCKVAVRSAKEIIFAKKSGNRLIKMATLQVGE